MGDPILVLWRTDEFRSRSLDLGRSVVPAGCRSLRGVDRFSCSGRLAMDLVFETSSGSIVLGPNESAIFGGYEIIHGASFELHGNGCQLPHRGTEGLIVRRASQ